MEQEYKMSLKTANSAGEGSAAAQGMPCARGTEADLDTRLEGYDFALPQEQIAQAPASRRDSCRLMYLSVRQGHAGAPAHHVFGELPGLLPSRSLLVANNVRVLPARLCGRRATGGAVEFLLLTPLPLVEAREAGGGWREALVEGLVRPAARMRPGFSHAFAPDLRLEVREKGAFGQARVLLSWQGELEAIFAREGHLPLPPYIRRPADAKDALSYQTVYAAADRVGAAAAPTAGLHFTPRLIEDLKKAGHEWAELTLYVGYGTFSPVREEDVTRHRMHEEYLEIPDKTAERVRQAKAEGRAVIAVGTTSVRALEGAFARLGTIAPYRGSTDIFLYPGKRAAVVDGLVTNFHLPRSTLMMLVSVFTGRRELLAAYRQAVEAGYRFFSYGDAMLIAPEEG